MSKTWIVLGIVILLVAGFLWFRGSKQSEMYTSGTDNSSTATTTPSGTDSGTTSATANTTVSSTSSVDQDLQAADNQMNQLGTDTASVDSSMK